MAALVLALALLCLCACDDPGDTAPTALPHPPLNAPLTTGDFSKIDKLAWKDGQFETIKLGSPVGIAAVVSGCGEDSGQSLELRLDDSFQGFELTLLQGRNSESPDQKLELIVQNNYGRELGRTTADIDTIGRLPAAGPPLKVNDVAVLDLKVYIVDNSNDASLGERACTTDDRVEAVLTNARLS